MSEESVGTRAVRHIAWRARRLASAAADRMRRGDRTVTMTPPHGLRFGNWLYLWLRAHEQSAAGRPWLVRNAPGMAEWFEPFPALRALTIDQTEVRFHDRRVWDHEFRDQRFGESFSRTGLDSFIRETLADGIPASPSDRVVVNVRRGDYYSQPHLREIYAFDQQGYLAEALKLVDTTAGIHVVSDDPQWCEHHLGTLLRSHADRFTFEPPGPLGNFRAVAGARRLIGTNSTFSYWGGYIAQVLHDDAQIVMPRFHARSAEGSDAYQLDPSWTVIGGHS